MLKIVALAIALVALRTSPTLVVPPSSGPVACTVETSVDDDALRAGERVEPRVAPAPFLERVPRPPLLVVDVRPPEAKLPFPVGALVAASQAGNQRLVVLQRIPRLESGDPPRA